MANKGSVGVPSLPRPKGGVTEEYINQLIAALELAFDAAVNDGPMVASSVIIKRLPKTPGGLRVGELWASGGKVRVVVDSIEVPTGQLTIDGKAPTLS